NEDKLYYPAVIHRKRLPLGRATHAVFEAADFRDSYHEAGHLDQLDMNTFHAFIGEDFPPCALRIDWVLLRDGADRRIETEGFDILRDAEAPLYPSDHYPVLAEL